MKMVQTQCNLDASAIFSDKTVLKHVLYTVWKADIHVNNTNSFIITVNTKNMDI